MTKRQRVAFTIAAFMLLAAAGLMWGYTTRWTIEKLDNIIKKEIPIGSSIASVDAMLTKYNFVHSTYIEELDTGNFDDKPEKLQGIAKGYIGGNKKNVGWSLLIRYSLFVRFYFNDRGEMIDYTIRWIGTGP
jgi:hypothetical protein